MWEETQLASSSSSSPPPPCFCTIPFLRPINLLLLLVLRRHLCYCAFPFLHPIRHLASRQINILRYSENYALLTWHAESGKGVSTFKSSSSSSSLAIVPSRFSATNKSFGSSFLFSTLLYVLLPQDKEIFWATQNISGVKNYSEIFKIFQTTLGLLDTLRVERESPLGNSNRAAAWRPNLG